jgi:hypothetical protein
MQNYYQIIGMLLYIINSTRPDISYAVSRLSRYTSRPDHSHWKALDKVLKYLIGTMTYDIYYSGYPTVLEAYSDAS